MPACRLDVEDRAARSEVLLRAALSALKGEARLKVRLGGISMSPFVRDGELVEIGKVGAQWSAEALNDVKGQSRAPLRRGLVIICTRGDDSGFTIHRIVGLRRVAGEVQVLTKGDALARADGWWDSSEVLGQVSSVYRAGRWVSLEGGWRFWLGWAYSWLWPLGPAVVPMARPLRGARRLLRKYKKARSPKIVTGQASHVHKTSATALLAVLTGARPVSKSTLKAMLDDLRVDNWDEVLKLAVVEGLAPLITAHLRNCDATGEVPPDVCSALEKEHRRNQALFAQQVYSLSKLADALETQQISYRLLKGPTIATWAYPVPTARAVGDIDLWVGQADVERAEAVLRNLGLERIVYPRPLPFLRAFAGEYEFRPRAIGNRVRVKGDGEEKITHTHPSPSPFTLTLPAHVDLHWHLVSAGWLRSSLHIPEQDIFGRGKAVEVAGRSYSTLDPTDALYHLCLHAKAGHESQGWRRLLDIHMLARTDLIDWPALNRLAITSGAKVILWRTFYLIDQFFGSGYCARLSWRPARWHRKIVEALLPPPIPGAPPPTSEVEPAPVELALLPGPIAAARAAFRIMWPSARWLRLRYDLQRGSVARARLRHLARLRLIR